MAAVDSDTCCALAAAVVFLSGEVDVVGVVGDIAAAAAFVDHDSRGRLLRSSSSS